MNRSYNRTVLDCGGCDTAFESDETSNSNGATPLKAVSLPQGGIATALHDASANSKIHNLYLCAIWLSSRLSMNRYAACREKGRKSDSRYSAFAQKLRTDRRAASQSAADIIATLPRAALPDSLALGYIYFAPLGLRFAAFAFARPTADREATDGQAADNRELPLTSRFMASMRDFGIVETFLGRPPV